MDGHLGLFLAIVNYAAMNFLISDAQSLPFLAESRYLITPTSLPKGGCHWASEISPCSMFSPMVLINHPGV